MELTQQDFEERMDRRDAGQASDEDMRLIEHYEREGYVRAPKAMDTSGQSNSQTGGGATEQDDAPADNESTSKASRARRGSN